MQPNNESIELPKRIAFKVDIAGIIEIMGTSLYSHPNTPIRELLQNAHDAIMRRRARDLSYQGTIRVIQNASDSSLTFEDDGIGLSPSEAEEYLGTLGVGITGLIKKGVSSESNENPAVTNRKNGNSLIGQFGIGLFSGFMLADRIVVESLRFEGERAIRWEAGAGTDIELSESTKTEPGTRVTLYLKANYGVFADDADLVEESIKQYAEFLPIPIYLNDSKARVNLIQAAWLEATPDVESMEEELVSYFGETPLEILPLGIETPVTVRGVLYVTPQRTPGFADEATVAVSVRRMVISRHIRELLPSWAPFLRGVLELPDCSPTSNREDLVRDHAFLAVCQSLEDAIYRHFEYLSIKSPARWQSILQWHRYTFAGMAIYDSRLRDLLKNTYKFLTSHGELNLHEILNRSGADTLVEQEAEYVIWYNADRRQEAWLNEFFSSASIPCVHTLRSFEETLLAAMISDTPDAKIELRPASPSSLNFTESILGIQGKREASSEWQEFLEKLQVNVLLADSSTSPPILAFVNERFELSKTFDEIKENGDLPKGFERIIQQHFDRNPIGKNEVILNTHHRIISKALKQGVNSPMANVLRVLVAASLTKAGAKLESDALAYQATDLSNIADALDS
jgi:HSP90 family molecular chaperone